MEGQTDRLADSICRASLRWAGKKQCEWPNDAPSQGGI